MEKIRKHDYIYAFWIVGGGHFFWLIKRDDQLVMQGIFNMKAYNYWHEPFVGEVQANTAISQMRFLFGGMAMKEYMCFSTKDSMPEEYKVLFGQQFKIYDKAMEEAEKARGEEERKIAREAAEGKSKITN